MTDLQQILQNFGTLLSDYYEAKHGRIPQVHPAGNTTLKYVLDQLDTTISAEESSAEEAIQTVINDFYQAVTEAGEEEPSASLDKIVNVFSENIKIAFSDLRTVGEQVDTLRQRIDNEIDRKVSADPFLSRHYGEDRDVEPTFPEINWSVTGAVGAERKIVTDLNSISSSKSGSEIPHPSVITNAAGDLRARLRDEFTEVPMSREKQEEIVNGIVEEHQISSDRVWPAMKIILQGERGRKKLSAVTERAEQVKRPMEACSQFITSLSDWQKVSDALADAELSQRTSSVLNTNLEIFREVLKLMAYFIIHCRRNVFQTTIVLPSGQINPDTKEDYFSKGGTLRKLSYHLRMFYPDEKLKKSRLGVTVTNAIESEGTVKENIEKQDRDNSVRLQRELNQITREAFVRHLSNFVKDARDPEKPMTADMARESIDALIEHNADSVVRGHSIEDAAYDVIFKGFYRKRFVNVLYKRLGIETMKMLSEEEEIEENSIRIIESRVVTELVTEFIVNSGLMQISSGGVDPEES